MSDTSQGPGWWQASDGKWYSPELYPKDWAPQAEAGEQATTPLDEPTEAVAEVTETPVADEPAPVEEPAEPEPPSVEIGSTTGASFAPPAEPTPPSGWAAPDPAAGEPTIAQPAVAAPDPTTVQPAVTPPPTPPPTPPIAAAPDSVAWQAPVSPPPVAPTSPDVRTATRPMAGSGPDVPGGALGIVGGLVAIVGSLLVWAEATGAVSGEVNGLTGSNGWGTLGAGLVLAALGGLLIAGMKQPWVGPLMIAAGLTAVGLAIYSVIDIGSTSDDLPAAVLAQGYPAEVANTAGLDPALGVWLALGGGAVGLIGGIAATVRR